jgi:Lon protease-like protein
MSDASESLEGFSGVARLFPLPHFVLFPSVVQPFHIFEPRYREMLADALEDDRLIALVMLEPGWEEDYHEQPPVHSVACLGRAFNEELLPDGRSNLLIHGVARIRIDGELDTDKFYRLARVTVLEDIPPTPPEEKSLREEMRRRCPRFLEAHGAPGDQAEKIFDSDLTVGALCDIFAFALPLDHGFKQGLLEELDVVRRVRALLDHLEARARASPGPEGRAFPPGFSEN